jgi:O-antigen ligase
MSGTFANSNSFGCFAGMALAATLALVFQEKRRKRVAQLDDEDEDEDDNDGNRIIKRLAGGTMILLALALLLVGVQLFSSSRAAFAVTVVVSIGRWRSRGQVGRTVVIGIAIGAVIVLIAGGAMLNKLSLVVQGGQFDRTIIWRSSLQAAQASPWLGWGLGNYADIYAAYQPDEIRQPNARAHSTPIQLYVETGVLGTVPGMLMPLIPFGVCLWGAWTRRRHRHLLVAAVAVPAIAMLHTTVDFSLEIPAIAFITAAFLGMGWAQTFNRTPTPRRARREVFTDEEE